MTHGKSFNLQQITVKTPGQRLPGTSRVATTPSSNDVSGSELTESVNAGGVNSDRSNSQSPPPGPLTSSLDVSYNSTTSGISSVRIVGPESHDYQFESLEQSQEFRAPLSPGPDQDDFGLSEQFEDVRSYGGPSYIQYGKIVNGRGHTRNGSLDDNTMLKQLRSGGKE